MKIIDSLDKKYPKIYAKHLKYKPKQDILKYLQSDGSFFKSSWSEIKIEKAVNYGYNNAISKGITKGKHTFKYAGEKITIVMENGAVQTAWGNYKYSYEQLLKLLE